MKYFLRSMQRFLRISSTQNRLAQGFIGALLMTVGIAAQAHTGQGEGSGFLAGILHPLTGIDHLLAMVAVGIWGATLGRPLIWALPVAFPLLMVIGGILGITGIPVTHVETGIAASVVILGAAIALAWRAPLPLALLIVGAFGVFHGYAHGTELPHSANPAAFVAGFVLCTGALHLAGIALGMIDKLPNGPKLLRGAGCLITGAGLWIFAGMPGVA